MLELVAGLSIAVACLVLVLEPLARPGSVVTHDESEPDWSDLDESDSPKVQALRALAEIDFDLATGKLGADDYRALKAKYAREAMEAITAEQAEGAALEAPQAESGDGEDAAEAAIRKARRQTGDSCPVCGGQLEHGAAFCSGCGCAVFADVPVARCWTCGSNLDGDVKFCADCGAPVAPPVRTGS